MNVKYKNGRTYGAFISLVQSNGKYKVYFIDDGVIMDDVEHNDISLPLTQGKASIDRDAYVGRVFFDKGGFDPDTKTLLKKGEFVVRRACRDNNFVCSRVDEGDDGEEVVFDISYVIRNIRKYEEEK